MDSNEKQKDAVYLYTDGACVPNPGDGGWAVLLEYNGFRKLIHGSIPDSTNQRMEIQAAIEGFKAIKSDHTCRVIVVSDSQYLINIMNNDWGRKSNWDLFEELDKVCARHTITWQWVKGHSGHPENEIVNRMAESEATKLYRERKKERPA